MAFTVISVEVLRASFVVDASALLTRLAATTQDNSDGVGLQEAPIIVPVPQPNTLPSGYVMHEKSNGFNSRA